ncbi:peptidase M13, N-terminal domain-containing protein, partial [Baffinella frigidus]
MRWKLIRNSGPYLSAEYIDGLVELNKDLYGSSAKNPRDRKCHCTDLYGTSAKNPRDRKCYGTVSADASWAAAKLYTEKVFKRENRDAALAMLDKVRAQFRATLKVEDWMDESDRTAATHKLDEMFFQ